MGKSLPYFIVDVFTETAFGGNQLAVIPDARGLTTKTMQHIAHEFNFSETTFVLPPESTENTRQVRIFTPSAELPFAGHPNIGTAFVLVDRALVEEISLEGSEETVLRFEERAGLVPVTVSRQSDGRLKARLTAPQTTSFGDTIAASELTRALGLDEEAVLSGNHPPRVAGSGIDFLCAELDSLDSLKRARLRTDLGEGGVDEVPGVLLYTRDTGDTGVDLRVRMFAPRLGVPEDPATGSAACALAGLLAKIDQRVGVEHEFVISQGSEIDRPSLLYASAIRESNGEVTSRVGGHSVLIASGELHSEVFGP